MMNETQMAESKMKAAMEFKRCTGPKMIHVPDRVRSGGMKVRSCMVDGEPCFDLVDVCRLLGRFESSERLAELLRGNEMVLTGYNQAQTRRYLTVAGVMVAAVWSKSDSAIGVIRWFCDVLNSLESGVSSGEFMRAVESVAIAAAEVAYQRLGATNAVRRVTLEQIIGQRCAARWPNSGEEERQRVVDLARALLKTEPAGGVVRAIDRAIEVVAELSQGRGAAPLLTA